MVPNLTVSPTWVPFAYWSMQLLISLQNIPMFSDLANWLRCYKRQAFLTETGGGNTDSCIQDICQQMAFLQANADVYVGYSTSFAGVVSHRC